jgi:ethylbenzene dioxygenase subunit beta
MKTEQAVCAPSESEGRISVLLEIEQFLFREARLLDENDYDGWLSLMAPDIHYWMPVIENRAREDPQGAYGAERLAYFDDSLEDLKRRIARFQGRTAWAENPATRHVHVISNVELDASSEPDEVVAHSVFINYRNRGERDQDTLVGRRRDVIRRQDGAWKLKSRRIVIAQNVLLSKNLNTFF